MERIRFYRIEDIVGQRGVSADQARVNKSLGLRPRAARPAIRGILPIGKASWELGIQQGKYPAGVKLGRVRVWPADQIEELAERIARGELASKAPARTPFARKVAEVGNATGS